MKRLISIFAVIFIINIPVQAQWLYKIGGMFTSPIEYRIPFRMSIFDIKFGSQILGTTSLTFDSTETHLSSFFTTRALKTIEVDFLKYNLLNHIIPQNFLDFHTGFGIKYASPFMKYELPSYWYTEGTPHYFMYPTLLEYNINQSVIYQWLPWLYNYFQFNYGKADVSTYKLTRGKYYLKQSGNTYSFALGVKILRNPKATFHEGYGIELKYTIANFDDFKDPEKISPITNLDFSSFSISLTLNPVIGGNPTIGDEAKDLYRDKDYIAAKEFFEKFLDENPKHPRRHKAQRMIERCIEKIPQQEIELANSFMKVKNFSKASQYLARASSSDRKKVLRQIGANYDSIRTWFVSEMDTHLVKNRIDEGIALLERMEKINIPGTEMMIKKYWSEIYFHKGAVFTEYEYWEKALHYFDLAKEKRPGIQDRIDPWLLKIAYGYIEDANKSIDQSDIEYTLESLRQATKIRPDVNVITEEHIKNLKAGLEYLNKKSIAEKFKDDRKSRQIKTMPEKVYFQIGMLSHKILSLYGEPVRKNQISDHLDQNFELWIYEFNDGKKKALYFKDDILQKIEDYSSKTP